MVFQSQSEKSIFLMTSRKPLEKRISSIIREETLPVALEIVDSGVQGLNRIYQCPPALILIDAILPDISGLQICRVLKHDPSIAKVPIILITQDNKEYERFTELTLIADAFIEEKTLNGNFTAELKRLMTVFGGLDHTETQDLQLLQQESVQVQALNRMVQLYDQAITEETIMKGFRKLFELTSNKNLLHHMFFSLLENVLDYDVAGIFFSDKNREPRLMTYHIAHDLEVKDYQLETWTAEVFDELAKQTTEPWAFSSHRHEVMPRIHNNGPGKTITLKYRSIFPFFVEKHLVGALVFYNRKKINYQLIFPFTLLQQELSALMRIRRYYSEAEMLSLSDPLTGLYTHQHFLWCVSREIRQAKRYNTPLSLAVVSIDNLRELNAACGHEVGDQVLKNISGQALQAVRNVDILARDGGRKILALFSNTPVEAAMLPLERIKQTILSHPPAWENTPLNLELSIGLVGLSEDIANASDFMTKAQKAVDEARLKGNNAVQLIE